MLSRTDLIIRADCTTTCLPARRVFASASIKDARTIPIGFRWSSVETVGRQWHRRYRLIMCRLFDMTGAISSRRVSGAIIRAENQDMLDEFLADIRAHGRGRPDRARIGRIVPIAILQDGTMGGWPTVEEFVRVVGHVLYPHSMSSIGSDMACRPNLISAHGRQPFRSLAEPGA